MIEKKQLELFVKKYCKLILSNGFSYIGTLIEVRKNSITFKDRFDGMTIFDIETIKSIGEVRGDRNDK